VRAEREDADSERVARTEHRPGQVDALSRVDRVEEPPVESVERVAVEFRAREPERNDRELWLREDLDSRNSPQLVGRPSRQLELLFEVASKGPDAVHRNR
jgi:hypothetical protein